MRPSVAVDELTPAVSSSKPSAVAVAAPVAPSQSLDQVFAALPASGAGPAEARLLSDNLESWNARWEMLETATTAVDADYFSLEKDVFGYAFLGALLKKQMEGVKVRVMTDAMADTFGQRGFKMPLRGKDYLQELVNHGGEAYVYHPIWQRAGDALRGDYSVLASNHDKTFTVDGKVGVTGGRNIGIDYFADPRDRKGAWRDMDVALEGKGVVAGLTAALDAEIANGNASRSVSPDRFGNWSKKDLQLLGAAALMDVWLKAPAFSEEQKAELRADPSGKQTYVDELLRIALDRVQTDLPPELRREPSKADVEMLTELATQMVDQLEARGSHQKFLEQRLPERQTEAKIIDQTSAAGTRVNAIAPALKALADAATKRIVIQNPYVVLTEDMMVALEQASKRGVEITIITNSPLSTDSAVTQAFFLEDWPYILARAPTARVFVATGDRKFHGKSAVIDDDQSVVSTYNLDLLSGYVNSEVAAVIKSKELAGDLLQAFEADTSNPENGFIEYTIERDADGKAKLRNGEPVVKFGPDQHLPAEVLEEYRGKRKLWGHTLRERLPYFEPLRHPKLSG